MLRIPALFLCHLLLWVVLAEINHLLGPWQLTLFAGGLFVTYAGLELEPREGLTNSLLAGFLFDAGSAGHFGLTAFLFGLTYCLVRTWKKRVMWDLVSVQSAVAVTANIGLYLALVAIRLHRVPLWYGYVTRTLWELVVSTVFVALCSPWAFALQARALDLAMPPKFRRPHQD